MNRRRTVSMILGLVATAAIAQAADAVGTGRTQGWVRPDATNVKPLSVAGARPEVFGPTAESISTFAYVAFRPLVSGVDFTTDFTSIWPTPPPVVLTGGFGGPSFDANLQVPEGAIIDYVTLTVCNSSGVTPPLIFGLTPVVGVDIVDVSLTNVAGCSVFSSPLIGYQQTVNENNPLIFFVNWEGGPENGSVKLRAGEVWWHRPVSPGPLTPTFNDVPTNDQGYDFVEAFVAAGITVGCDTGPPARYCPDDFVTRRQMAVFFAKALGLHWPNP